MDQHRLPRDPQRLLREVDATIRIKDIQEWHRLRETVSIKWWESALIALLFVSGVGIVVTVAELIPARPSLLYYFILGWSILWILTLITCIEFLIHKFRALRRMHEITDRVLRRLESDLDSLHAVVKSLHVPEEPPATPSRSPVPPPARSEDEDL